MGMTISNVIAIDGPAASGKTTLGRLLAGYLGYVFFDTGIMYRAVTWAALQNSVPIQDEEAVNALAERLVIDVRQPSISDGRGYDVWVDGQDVTWQIRSPEVEADVSAVSAYPGVRRALTAHQRRIGLRGRVVMVGRDIGTVVMPEATLKIYLNASVGERAKRRYMELVSRGEKADLEVIRRSVEARDHIDSTRDLSPLRPAEDAILLESDGLDVEQIFNRAKELVKQARVEQ
jgi:cytidylate kinase